MSRHPREPLSVEERALAKQLPRLHARSEPAPALDARILGTARAAAAPTTEARPRMHWMAPMAVAASLSLAVGLAWRLQPPPAPPADVVAPAANTANDPMPAVPVPESASHPGQERPASSPPVPSSARARVRDATVERVPQEEPHVTPPAPSPARTAPQAPPAAPLPAPMIAAKGIVASETVAAPAVPVSSPAMASQPVDPLRERNAAASAMPRAQAREASIASDATVRDPQAFIGDDPGEDVPPATVDSPEVRSAWLQRIGELHKEGRTEEARASLAEFRRRHPDAPLPAELRTLDR